MKTIIETDRLILRVINKEDKQNMFRLHSNAEVQRFTGEPVIESIEAMEKAILTRMEDYKTFGYGRWGVFLKEDKQFIGWAGLAYLPEFDEIDLGYRFLPEHWGKGYATEASQSILTYSFKKLGLKRIIAIAMKENKASIRVMEKVGMQFDKYAPYDPGGEDVVWYHCNCHSFSVNKD